MDDIIEIITSFLFSSQSVPWLKLDNDVYKILYVSSTSPTVSEIIKSNNLLQLLLTTATVTNYLRDNYPTILGYHNSLLGTTNLKSFITIYLWLLHILPY